MDLPALHAPILRRRTHAKRRLRVLAVINELAFGGDENRLLNFASSVDASCVDVTVATIKRPTELDCITAVCAPISPRAAFA